VWVLGAFEPATGLATTLRSPWRDSASFIQLLEQVLQTYPAREWVLITDNLSTHLSRETQTALIAWPEVELLFIPKYACWLNLIELWWKQLRSLALKAVCGRRRDHRGGSAGDDILEPASLSLRLEKSCLTSENDH
jgi:transposase